MARGVLLLGFSFNIPLFVNREYRISRVGTIFNHYFIKLAILEGEEILLRSMLRRMMRDHDKEKSCI